MKHLLSLLALLTISVVAQASERQVEVLIGYVRHERGMVFQVYSGGCTDKKDFEIVIDHQNPVATLTLYRVFPDYCKAYVPFGGYISFDYEELKLSKRQPVHILNPLNPGYIF